MDREIKAKRAQHPREAANIVSKLSFFYTLGLFKKGYARALDEDDLYDVLGSCNSKKLGDQLEMQWELERKKHTNPSLYRVLVLCFWKKYLFLGVVQLVMRTIMVLSVPQALGKLVSFFSPGQTTLTKEDAYYYAAMVIAFNIINFIYSQNYMIALTEFSIRVRTAICSLVYRKTLRMTSESLAEVTVGKIVTLITKDVHAFEVLIFFGNDIWIGLIQTALICYLIYGKIGVAAFAGIGFFLVVLPLQVIIGKMAASFRLKTSKKTDERLQITQETLSAMKIIKMYAWEKFFNTKISSTRRIEINAIHKLFYMRIIILLIGSLTAKIAFYLLIMTHVWLGNNITAEIVYFVMSCFGKLHFMLTILFPLGIAYAAELVPTNTRLLDLLEKGEVPPHRDQMGTTTKKPRIVFKEVTLTIKQADVFNNISLEVDGGLNVIVGHIGCGKTTFIKMILHEYSINGNLDVFGSISYASQEPWLFPSSVKNNILFGEEFCEKRYRRVLEICALNHDLELLDNGDDTIVGDNGTNLSKGQQARLNLARAIYKDSDIYLLDDCLAALDGHVADFIFKECVQGFLKNKLCIFVTNNNHHIQEADKVMQIHGGSINYIKKSETAQEELEIPVALEAETKPEFAKDDQIRRNIYHEAKKSGKVDLTVYKSFIGFGGGLFVFSLILGTFVAAQGTMSYTDKLVSSWVTLEQNLSSYKMNNLTDSEEYEEVAAQRVSILNLYTIMIVTATVLSLVRSFSFFTFIRRASINLHKTMIAKITNAKMAFFDSHFIGNVLNRFSKDLCTIDEYLPFTIDNCFELLFVVLGIMFLVISVNAIFLIPSAIFFLLAYFVRFVYQRTGRSLQRLNASTRGPLIGHLNASLEGLTTIRAFGAEEIVKDDFDRHQDLYTSANYTVHCSMRAMSFVLDGMCSVFIVLVIARFLLLPVDTTVGNVGLAISQAFSLTHLLQFGIRRWSDFENEMTSVERVLEYTEVDQEKKSGQKAEFWPKEGKIQFEDVSLSYSSETKPILNNINFTIEPRQKVGIVGRTGAGKSSIISSLFRLYETEGKIIIDGVDIQTLPMEFLRSSISIIPQDPVLFSGTIRENIDPLNQHEDDEIWKVIKTTKLEDIVDNLSKKIDHDSNFSAGQKQLICLARAMVRRNKIVVLDEATANLDQETDALIGEVIRSNFVSATVITIAHRMSSVLASDMVMVVSDGKIVEMGQPRVLVEDDTSLFHKMAKKL